MSKKKEIRRLLTDSQCRIFLKDMKEFGYPTLTFEKVRELADAYAAGEDREDVISIIMRNEIDDATK